MKRIFKDTFNMFCGDKIGSGIHRDVFECKLRPEFVVKVEHNEIYRSFANVKEMQFWCDWRYYQPVAKWLAPCEFLSPDGFVLLQKRCEPLPRNFEFPSKMPKFLTDIKPENFGLLDGNLVCLDYALTIVQARI